MTFYICMPQHFEQCVDIPTSCWNVFQEILVFWSVLIALKRQLEDFDTWRSMCISAHKIH